MLLSVYGICVALLEGKVSIPVGSATVGPLTRSVAPPVVESTSLVVPPALTMLVEGFVVVPVVNADALDELVVPTILGKDVVDVVVNDGIPA